MASTFTLPARSGVWRSLDGGSTWNQALNVTNGANGAMDLVMRTDQATDYIFAAVGSFARAHIFRNTDAGGSGTWQDVFSEVNQGASLAMRPQIKTSSTRWQHVSRAEQEQIQTSPRSRTPMACSASSGPHLQAMPVHGPHRRATTAPLQDTLLLSNPVNGALTQCGIGTSQMLNQGWYDNVLVVDPRINKVWAGGVDLFRSDNGGVNWGVASYWWFQGTALHQQRQWAIRSRRQSHHRLPSNYNGTTNQTMLPATTAAFSGPTMRRPATSATRTAYGRWRDHHAREPDLRCCIRAWRAFHCSQPGALGPVNNGYAVTQFYHGLPYPNGQTYFGGTQDNGTNRGTDVTGPNAWARINGGDGGYVAVNPANTNTIFFETTGLSLRRSTNGGASSASVITGITGDVFPFITVFRMDPTTPTRLWIGGRFMWRTDNNARIGSGPVTRNRPAAQSPPWRSRRRTQT